MIGYLRTLFKNPNFIQYLVNSSWIFGEFLIRVVSVIFVSIFIARYLGPERFGLLSFALAYLGVFLALTRLGMDSILVREVSKNQHDLHVLLGTSHSLMTVSGVLGFVLSVFLVTIIENDRESQLLILYMSIALVFQGFLVVDYSFQGQVKARYSSISKSVALMLSSCIKILLVYLESDLVYFVIAQVFEHFLIAFFLICSHYVNSQPFFIFKFDKKVAKKLLISSWPMVLSSLAIILAVRIDQFMINIMLGPLELGLYAAAVKIYEGWVFFPYIVSISLLPAIVKLKGKSADDYELNMARLFSLLFWLGIISAIFSALYGDWFISIIYGSEYSESAAVLSIIMWGSAFTALGSLASRYLIVEGMEKKIALRTILSLIINILANIILIPIYGIEGAAFATLLSIFVANYFINYFDADLSQLLRITNKAILLRLVK